MTKRRTLFCITLLCTLFSLVGAESNSYSGPKANINGYIKDAANGEVLVGATIMARELKTGAVSNTYGFYSLSLQPGKYTIEWSYIGYTPITRELEVKGNIKIDIELTTGLTELDEVVIKSDRPEDKIKRAEMSVNKMDMKTIKKIPALMGEVDLIKAIQLLPGVQSTSDGSSNFSVRGGGSDQNLILLDEATVYNASHLMGFFSVFNNDAVKDVKLYKGDIPASSGGRLSSLLDVRMKEGNSKKLHGTGGIGLISSRLTLEGPLITDKSSFIISGRRTYADVFFPLLANISANDEIKNVILYFYDLNAKINYTIGDNDRIFFSAYGGMDKFGSGDAAFGFGNNTYTFRWNHQYSPRLFSNLALISSKYNYEIGNGTGKINSILWYSNMNDYSIKLDYNFYLNPRNSIRFGAITTYHRFNPGYIGGVGEASMFKQAMKMPYHYALEHGVYVSNEQELTDKLTFKYGLRFSAFQNIGKDYIYNIDKNYKAKDSTVYGNNKIINTYTNLEPRAGLNYRLNDVSSLKASYSRTAQYVQLASNSTAGTPLDVWFPVNPNIKPQLADQYSVGYVRNLAHNTIETSVEVYYKDMWNVVDFKDNASLMLNERLDAELRFGNGRAYGAEFMVQLNTDKTNGWISYTYSNTTRKVKGLSDAYPDKVTEYLSPFDKPHTVNVVLNRDIATRWSVSANWVYSTGAPVTLPAFRWKYEGLIMPGYTERNSFRMPNYHRLDVSVTFKPKKQACFSFLDVCWNGEWNLSVYNAYNQHNTWSINFAPDEKNPNKMVAMKTYLFSVIPAITYNFNF